jgi:hypothetical protein
LSVLTLEYGIRSGITSLNWLKSVSKRVQDGNYTLDDIHI